jgi:Ca2+-transporting ATPase
MRFILARRERLSTEADLALTRKKVVEDKTQINDNGEKVNTPSQPEHGLGSGAFTLDLTDALTPDPGTEHMFHVQDNKFAFSAGQLSKMLNPKSHLAFYAMGGLAGLEKGLRTDRQSGLSIDEATLDGSVAFESVATRGTPKHGTAGETLPAEKEESPTSVPTSATGGFSDRKRIFADNRLPEKKSKTIFQLAWQTYNDKVLILLSVVAVVSLALGLYQTFGGAHEEGQAKLEWVEGVAILVAIILVVVVGTVNDCESFLAWT